MTSGYISYVLEQLASLGAVRARGMFGGHGIYSGESFFALVANDTLYFKVDDGNRADFERHGKRPFVPFPDKPELVMNYYEVPADVVEDPEELVQWARRALDVARRAAAIKAARQTSGKRRKKARRP
jgi:DNA transformation protein and related proteins